MHWEKSYCQPGFLFFQKILQEVKRVGHFRGGGLWIHWSRKKLISSNKADVNRAHQKRVVPRKNQVIVEDVDANSVMRRVIEKTFVIRVIEVVTSIVRKTVLRIDDVVVRDQIEIVIDDVVVKDQIEITIDDAVVAKDRLVVIQIDDVVVVMDLLVGSKIIDVVAMDLLAVSKIVDVAVEDLLQTGTTNNHLIMTEGGLGMIVEWVHLLGIVEDLHNNVDHLLDTE